MSVATGAVCMPLDRVLGTVYGVEQDMIRFYRLVLDHAGEGTVKRTLAQLLEKKSGRAESIEKLRGVVRAGDEVAPDALPDYVQFLNVLAKSAFSGGSGNPVDRFDAQMTWPEVVDTALELERSLLLFYLKFYHVACADQRPVFSRLSRDSERDIATLDGLRDMLRSGTGSEGLRPLRRPVA